MGRENRPWTKGLKNNNIFIKIDARLLSFFRNLFLELPKKFFFLSGPAFTTNKRTFFCGVPNQFRYESVFENIYQLIEICRFFIKSTFQPLMIFDIKKILGSNSDAFPLHIFTNFLTNIFLMFRINISITCYFPLCCYLTL